MPLKTTPISYNNLSEQYLYEYCPPDSLLRFHNALRDGQRLGQAWFNSLPGDQAQDLAGLYFDPFHKDGPPAIAAIEKSIEFLLYSRKV